MATKLDQTGTHRHLEPQHRRQSTQSHKQCQLYQLEWYNILASIVGMLNRISFTIKNGILTR